MTSRPPEEVARAGVGYVPQVDDVFAPLTVRENLEMGGYLLRPKEVKPRIDDVVTVFPRLAAMLARQAGKLSGGERKMLAMGRVLMLEPVGVPAGRADRQPRPGHRPLPARGTRPPPRRRAAPRSWSSSSAPARCSPSPTTPTSSPAARSAWRAPRPNWPPAPAFVESFLGGTVTR